MNIYRELWIPNCCIVPMIVKIQGIISCHVLGRPNKLAEFLSGSDVVMESLPLTLWTEYGEPLCSKQLWNFKEHDMRYRRNMKHLFQHRYSSLPDFQNVGIATSFFLPPVQSVTTEPFTITKSHFTRFCFIACYSLYPWFTPSLADSSYLWGGLLLPRLGIA